MRNKYNSLKNSRVFKAPYDLIRQRTITVQNFERHLMDKVKLELKDNRIKLVRTISKLDTLSPLKTLVRGYSITEKDGKVVSSSNDLKSGDCLNLRFIDGSKEAVVK
jgi:exodeoxyribonuclease VII large subunit